MSESLHSQFESIFEETSWKKEQRMQAFARLRRKMWNLAGVLALLIGVLFLTAYLKRIDDLIMGLILLFGILLVVQFIASIIGVLCALIPIKNYHFDERLEGWIPLWTVIIEVAIIALFIVIFFLEFI